MDMQENCLQAYAEKGWLLQFSKDIDSNRQDCFFHDGEYATARREIDGHQVEVSFTTQGALSASLEIYDMSNDFPSSSELSHREKLFGYIPDDATLEQAIGEDRLRFSNTNWNEMYVFVDGKQIGDPLTLENGLLNDFPSPFRLERELKTRMISLIPRRQSISKRHISTLPGRKCVKTQRRPFLPSTRRP